MDVRLPDGTIIQNVPDDISRADLVSKLKSNGYDTSKLGAPADTSPDWAKSVNADPASSVGAGIAEPALAMASGAMGSAIGGIGNLAGAGVTKVGNMLGLTDKDPMTVGNNVQQGIQNAVTYQPQTDAGKRVLGAIGTPFDYLAKKADQAGGAVTDATGSPMLGAAANTALQSLPQLVMEGAKFAPVVRPLGTNATALESANRLAAQGINLTPAQATGNSTLRMANAALDNLPISGTMQKNARTAQNVQVNQALGRAMGIDNATNLKPQVIADAKANIGARLDALEERNAVSAPAVESLTPQLSSVLDSANRYVADPGAVRVIKNHIDDILSKVTEDGTIEGPAFQSLNSTLRNAIKSSNNPDVQTHLGNIRTALKQSMDASVSPEDAAAWREANTQYYNLKRIAPAVIADTGDVSIAKLMQNIKTVTGNESVGGNIGQLASDLKSTIGDKVPDSGTAGRTFMSNLLTGGVGGAAGVTALSHPGVLAGLAIPPIAQKLFNSAGMRSIATNGIDVGGALTAADRARILALIQASQQQP